MQETLKHKLVEYIQLNNPEILLVPGLDIEEYLNGKLQAINDLPGQLQAEDKASYIIEELCFNELVKDLKPSKFNYISSILEEEFEFAYWQFKKSDTLIYEVVNLIPLCNPVFDAFNFSEHNEDDRQLRYGIMGVISNYLEDNQ